MAALARVLSNDGRGEPESRLLWAAGKETMMACFHVGVYSDRELVGQGQYSAGGRRDARIQFEHLLLQVKPEM